MTTDMINDLYQPIKLFETIGGQVIVTRGEKVYFIQKVAGYYTMSFSDFCDILTGDALGCLRPDPYTSAAEIAEDYCHVATFHTDESEFELLNIPGAAGIDFIGDYAQYRFVDAETATHYNVANPESGISFGTIAADSPEEALDIVARDAGYEDYQAARQMTEGTLVATEVSCH